MLKIVWFIVVVALTVQFARFETTGKPRHWNVVTKCSTHECSTQII